MEEKEIIKNLKEKIKEISNLGNLNSRDFKFKSWHVSTLNMLRSLPPRIYSKFLNDFKKLTFTDTKYHRDKKDFNSDIEKYSEDLAKAEEILKRITKLGSEAAEIKKEPDSKPENSDEKPENSTKKTEKKASKKSGSKKLKTT
jgi:hypothetical protein